MNEISHVENHAQSLVKHLPDLAIEARLCSVGRVIDPGYDITAVVFLQSLHLRASQLRHELCLKSHDRYVVK